MAEEVDSLQEREIVGVLITSINYQDKAHPIKATQTIGDEVSEAVTI